MDILHIALGLIALGVVFSLMNWSYVVLSWVKKRHVSLVPLVGAIPLGCGLVLLPQTRPFAWLALVADCGTLGILLGMPFIVREIWSTSRFNLLHSFASSASGRQVSIKLFRRHVAVISVKFDPPIRCVERDSYVQSFGMVGNWSLTESGYQIDGYGADRQLRMSLTEGGYLTEELNYPKEKGRDFDSLGGIKLELLGTGA